MSEETGRLGDGETWRWGDMEMGRHGDGETWRLANLRRGGMEESVKANQDWWLKNPVLLIQNYLLLEMYVQHRMVML